MVGKSRLEAEIDVHTMLEKKQFIYKNYQANID